MDATRRPRATGMSRRGTAERVPRARALLVSALLVASIEGAAQDGTAAVWKLREVAFFYRSSTAVYSCSALKGRVTSILRAVGARGDLEVEVYDCVEFRTPPDAGINDAGTIRESPSDRFGVRAIDHQQTADVRISMMMPTAATPAVLAEIEREKSLRELVLRTTGKPATRLTDPNVFTAQLQHVTLSRKTIGLEPPECELLEQMSNRVFRPIGVRVIRRGYTCDPRQVSRIYPELEVEALLPALFVTGDAQQMPAPGEGETDAGKPGESDEGPGEPDPGKAPE